MAEIAPALDRDVYFKFHSINENGAGLAGNPFQPMKQLHFGQRFGRKSGRVDVTTVFCTLLFNKHVNIWNIHAKKMYKVQPFVGKSNVLRKQWHLAQLALAHGRFFGSIFLDATPMRELPKFVNANGSERRF